MMSYRIGGLTSATELANSNSEHSHSHYNLRSRDKRFVEGDTVIVLDVDASSKKCRRWQGPATVIKVKSPHSYLVDMGDGRVRHVHANKMRKFHIHVQGCNVISEADSDFGRVIVPVNVSENVLPSINVDCDKLCHLYHTQQQEL